MRAVRSRRGTGAGRLVMTASQSSPAIRFIPGALVPALARETDLTVFFCHRQDAAGQACGNSASSSTGTCRCSTATGFTGSRIAPGPRTSPHSAGARRRDIASLAGHLQFRRVHRLGLVFEELSAGHSRVPQVPRAGLPAWRFAARDPAIAARRRREVPAVPLAASSCGRPSVRRTGEPRVPASLRRARQSSVLRTAFRRQRVLRGSRRGGPRGWIRGHGPARRRCERRYERVLIRRQTH